MRLRPLILFLALPLASAAAQTSPSPQPAANAPSIKDQLVGAWRLVSVETLRPGGEIIYPYYGKHPQGLLIYDRSGWMSVQIVSDPMPMVPRSSSREDFVRAPQAEKSAAIDGYYAYFGTWTVNEAASSVTHHIHHSLYPAERDQDGIRGVTLQDDRLTLTAKAHEMGEDHQRRLVWERVTAP